MFPWIMEGWEKHIHICVFSASARFAEKIELLQQEVQKTTYKKQMNEWNTSLTVLSPIPASHSSSGLPQETHSSHNRERMHLFLFSER